jgi:hypothetical protein
MPTTIWITLLSGGPQRLGTISSVEDISRALAGAIIVNEESSLGGRDRNQKREGKI